MYTFTRIHFLIQDYTFPSKQIPLYNTYPPIPTHPIIKDSTSIHHYPPPTLLFTPILTSPLFQNSKPQSYMFAQMRYALPSHPYPIHIPTLGPPQNPQSNTLPPAQNRPPNPQNNRHPRAHPRPPLTRPILRPSHHPRHRDRGHGAAGAPTGPGSTDGVSRAQTGADGVVYAEFRVC
jgi:hypothetical protein